MLALLVLAYFGLFLTIFGAAFAGTYFALLRAYHVIDKVDGPAQHEVDRNVSGR